MPRAPLPLLLVLSIPALLPALAAAEEQNPAEIAASFLAAFRAGDAAHMSILAAQPARATPYALVVQALLEQGQGDAALALAEARNGGPEGDGLERLVAVYPRGGRPTREQLLSLQRAEGRIARKEGDLALSDLEGAGEPSEGTVFGARIFWTRARALHLGGKAEEAIAAYRGCAKFAASVGWITLAREAQRAWLSLARGGAGGPGEALRAAEAFVETNALLDDNAELLPALGARAQLRLAAGDSAKAREDYTRAIELARQMGEKRMEALLLGSLGFVFQTREGAPKSARRWYEKAVGVARESGDPALLRQCLYNLSTVETELGRYAEALSNLEELFATEGGGTGAMRLGAMAQRAYVLRRLGFLEESRAAYAETLAAMPDDRGRAELEADLGDLEMERLALAEAAGHYDADLAAHPGSSRSLAGKAAIEALRGNAAESDALFARALEAARDPGDRGRVLLQRAALQRVAGRTHAARSALLDALKEYEKGAESEYGNAAAAWSMLGDLLLLDGDRDAAEKALAQASVFFTKLQDVGHAIPALVRETLVLLASGQRDSASARLSQLRAFAAGTTDGRLRSLAKIAEAMAAGEEGAPLWTEAADLAHDAGEPILEATARTHLALVAADLAELGVALDLVDSVPEEEPQWRPPVPGESADHAASIGVRLLLAGPGDEGERAARALPLIERARQRRLAVALRGRDAILRDGLGPELRADYLAARGSLIEARLRKAGLPAARARFDGVVERIRSEAPAAAALAFPRTPSLSQLQAAMRDDEVLVLMLEDDYTGALLAIDRKSVLLRPSNPKDPLAPAAPLLAGKRTLLLAPDGGLALPTLRWQDGMALDAFEMFLVSTAGSFLRQRQREWPSAGQGMVRMGGGPGGPEAPDGARPRLCWLATPLRLELSRPPALPRVADHPAADALFAAEIAIDAGPRPGSEGLWALAESIALGGTRHVALALAGPVADAASRAIVAEGVERGLSFPLALRQEQRKARRTAKDGEVPPLLGVVVYGVP